MRGKADGHAELITTNSNLLPEPSDSGCICSLGGRGMSGWTGGQGQGVRLPGGCSDSSGTGRRPGVLWAPGQVLATSTETSTGWWPCLHRGPPAGWLGPPSAFPGEAGSLSFPRPAKSQLLPVPAGRGVRGQRRKTGCTWNSQGPTGPLADKYEGAAHDEMGCGGL